MRYRNSSYHHWLPCLTMLTLASFNAAAGGQETPSVRSERPERSQYVPPGYVKVFSDEFNREQLDTQKWWTRYIYSGGTLDFLNDEQERYREDHNHIESNGILNLTAYVDHSLDPNGRNIYRSGMIRSKFTLKYGYLEARVKMPRGLGVWPAFWLNSDADPTGRITWPPEVDIFEFVNNGTDDKINMLHTGVINQGAQTGDFLYTDPNFNEQWTYWTAPFDFPDRYHVIGLLWDTDDTVTTFVDGLPIVKRSYKWVYNDGTPAGFAHILLNLAIGGSWAGRYGVDNNAFPQALAIDYVRVYQKLGHWQTGSSFVGVDLCPVDGGC
jgi:beta-glucanase (GH16 family)